MLKGKLCITFAHRSPFDCCWRCHYNRSKTFGKEMHPNETSRTTVRPGYAYILVLLCTLSACETTPRRAVLSMERPSGSEARPATEPPKAEEANLSAKGRFADEWTLAAVPHSARPRSRTPEQIRAWDPDINAYDATLIAAVERRWLDLLWHRTYDPRQEGHQKGEVTLVWTLHADGSISDLRILKNEVDVALAKLCQSAVRDLAPFAPWPYDLRQKQKDQREITLSFRYD